MACVTALWISAWLDQQMDDETYHIINRLPDEMTGQITFGEYDGSPKECWTEGKTNTFQLQ